MTPPHKPKGEATKYPGVSKLQDGRYLVVTSWIDSHTGRRCFRQKIVTGTVDEAVKARAGLRGQEQSATAPSRPRFAAFAESWLKIHKKTAQLSPSTEDRYTNDIAHLRVEFGTWWVDAIDYDALRDKQAELTEHYAAQTINGWHRTLRLVLDDAVRRHLLATNPARELSTLREGRTQGARGQALSAVELRAFIAAIPGRVEAQDITAEVGRMIRVLAWTGMRIGELVALAWYAIADGEIRVEHSVWRGQIKPTKTDDPRRITIAAPLVAILEEQRRHLLTTQHAGLSSGLVFPGSPAQVAAGAARRQKESPGAEIEPCWYRSQSAVARAVKAVCEAAKCTIITPHALRRTFEDLLRSAGVEQLVRRAIAGWRSERAQGIYATVSREDRDAAAEAVTRLIQG